MTKTRLLVAIPACIGFSLATLPARAEPPAAPSEAALSDAVELKNGGYLRGLIIEVVPGSHLSLRTPDGQVRRITVGEIQSAERGGKPVELGPTPAPGAAGTAPAAPTVGTEGTTPGAPVAAGAAVAVAPHAA